MKTTLLLFISLLVTSALTAQNNGNLTVYSNTGKKFFVVLNGERQNLVAQTNVKITGIKADFYKCRVIAEDESFNFEKNIVVKENREITYRIKGKRRRFKLKFYNEQPLEGASATAENQYEVEYGTNQTTTTQNNGNGGSGAITITNNGQQGSDVNEGNVYQDEEVSMTFSNGGCGTTDAEISAVAMLVKAADFSDDKMKIALKTAKEKCMSIDQIRTIATVLDFSENKMEFVKAAYLNCLEQADYSKLKNVFSFTDDKEDFQAFLTARGR